MTIRSTLATSLTLALVGLVGVTTLLATAPVFAHARYKSSTPGTGEVITASPARVDIIFTEQIQKVSGTYDIEVTRDRGASVTAGAAVVDDADRHNLSVPLQPNLAPGRYVVNWKNTSDDDGDPVTGAFSFYVNAQPNAVDLENDRQLAQIGFEEVTATAAAGNATPGAEIPSATSGAATAAPNNPIATTSASISPATPTTTSGDSNDDDSNSAIYVIAALVVIGAVGGFVAWRIIARRGT
jgi:copper resistance protein C